MQVVAMSWWRAASTALTDFGLRVVAVILAVVVIVHARSAVERETLFEVPLRVRNIQPGLILATELPAAVQVKLRASVNTLIRLQLGPPEIELDLSGAHPGEIVQRRLTAGEVRLPLRTTAEVLEIVQPRTISLGVDEPLSREVRVQPVMVGTLPAGMTLGGIPTADPPVVSLYGPRRSVESLELLRTEPFDLGRAAAGEAPELALGGLPPGSAATPPRIRLRLTLDQLAEETFRGIPLTVLRNRLAGEVVAEPSRVDVTLRGARGLLALIRPSQLAARVDARNLLEGKHFLIVEVVPPGEGVTIVGVSPDHAAITLQ